MSLYHSVAVHPISIEICHANVNFDPNDDQMIKQLRSVRFVANAGVEPSAAVVCMETMGSQ